MGVAKINLNNLLYLVEITYYFEFLVVKSISFIVLTHFFPVQST